MGEIQDEMSNQEKGILLADNVERLFHILQKVPECQKFINVQRALSSAMNPIIKP